MSEFEKALKEKLDIYLPHQLREECFKDGSNWAYEWCEKNKLFEPYGDVIARYRKKEKALESKLEKTVEYLEECNSKLKVPEPFMVAEIKGRGE